MLGNTGRQLRQGLLGKVLTGLILIRLNVPQREGTHLPAHIPGCFLKQTFQPAAKAAFFLCHLLPSFYRLLLSNSLAMA